MKKLTLTLMTLLLALGAWADDTEESDSINKAMQVLDSFMYSFNARDMNSWSETLNYPHVRIAGGKVTVWDTKEEYSATNVFNRLTATGWDHSAWLSKDVVLVSKNKVHISTVFQRYDKNNNPMKKYQSLYVVTNDEGHWGVQARSSLAP
ncbi:MAG TPA: hypothetical protein QGF66_03660 [SAR86 cluster bacterium]|nr:hypothetical protein [SAR86 cluster bacterium]